MAKIVITKTGDLMEVVHGTQAARFDEYARNMQTGQYIAKLNNDEGIETDILCTANMQYNESMFDTIGGVSITTNQLLFDELVKML